MCLVCMCVLLGKCSISSAYDRGYDEVNDGGGGGGGERRLSRLMTDDDKLVEEGGNQRNFDDKVCERSLYHAPLSELQLYNFSFL